MEPITSIKQYWTVHKWYQVGLLDIEKMTRKIDDLTDKRSRMDKQYRKPLSDQIVALTYDRARLQGKGMQMDKALRAYYVKKDPSFWGFIKRLVGK